MVCEEVRDGQKSFTSKQKGSKHLVVGTILSAFAVVAICALMLSVKQDTPETELLLDSDTIADKILKNQHFHKASQAERETILKHILSKGPAGSLASKMAHAVADKHETYRQRIDAMKKLLDMHTDALKSGKVKHGAIKASLRAHKAVVTVKDKTNPKAIQDGVQLIEAAKKKHIKRLHLSAKDAKIKAESEHSAADPKKLDKWMKNQVKGVAKKVETPKASTSKLAETTPASPARVRHNQQKVASSQHADSGKKATNFQRLVKWAEAHGLPKKLANNPKDRTKVKDIIARMKADAEVEKIQQQFAHDDATVGDVIHSADPGAAGAV